MTEIFNYPGMCVLLSCMVIKLIFYFDSFSYPLGIALYRMVVPRSDELFSFYERCTIECGFACSLSSNLMIFTPILVIFVCLFLSLFVFLPSFSVGTITNLKLHSICRVINKRTMIEPSIFVVAVLVFHVCQNYMNLLSS